jgi:hypothetical protein
MEVSFAEGGAKATTSPGNDAGFPVRILDGHLFVKTARPAGSISASITEMAAWMSFLLDPVTGHGDLRRRPRRRQCNS